MTRIKGTPEFPFDIILGEEFTSVEIGGRTVSLRGILVIDLETMELALAYNPEETRLYHFFDSNHSGDEFYTEIRYRIEESAGLEPTELEIHELAGGLLAGLIDVNGFRKGHRAAYKTFVPLPGYPLPKRGAIAV